MAAHEKTTKPLNEQIQFYEHEIARLTPARNEYQLYLRNNYKKQLKNCQQNYADLHW